MSLRRHANCGGALIVLGSVGFPPGYYCFKCWELVEPIPTPRKEPMNSSSEGERTPKISAGGVDPRVPTEQVAPAAPRGESPDPFHTSAQPVEQGVYPLLVCSSCRLPRGHLLEDENEDDYYTCDCGQTVRPIEIDVRDRA